MNFTFTLIIFVSLFSSSYGDLGIQTFGSDGEDVAWEFFETNDGNFVMTGTTTGWGATERDVVIAKMGNITWIKVYQSSFDISVSGMCEATDGLIVSGSIFVSEVWNGFLFKVHSENGGVMWKNRFFGDMAFYYSPVCLESGNILVPGTNIAVASPNLESVLLSLLDSNGTVLWNKCYGSSLTDKGYSLEIISEESVIINGYTNIGSYARFLVGVFNLSSIEPTWFYGYYSELSQIEQALKTRIIYGDDEEVVGFLILGFVNHPSQIKGSFVRIDTMGNILWSKVVEYPGRCMYCSRIEILGSSDNMFAVVLGQYYYTATPNFDEDPSVGFELRIDLRNGELVYAEEFNFTDTQYVTIHSAHKNTEWSGNVVFSGNLDYDFLVGSLDEDGYSCTNGKNETQGSLYSHLVYDNITFTRTSIGGWGEESCSPTPYTVDIIESTPTLIHERNVICKNYWLCSNVSNYNTSFVCSSHGWCVNEDVCKCYPEYVGEWCEVYTCFGILMNLSSVCMGFGVCESVDNCVCPSEDSGCVSCFGKMNNDTENDVCGGHGLCFENNNCSCNESYYGEECMKWECNGKLWTDPGVCDFGNCPGPGTCECNELYYGDRCNITMCEGVLSNSTTENLLCSGHGECLLESRTCNCTYGYSNASCDYFECTSLPHDHPSVCSGHGFCGSFNVCTCDEPGYNRSGDCSLFECFGVDNHLVDDVCSEHGSCIGYNNCSCTDDGYGGENCESWKCYGVFMTEVGKVCAGHGSCIDHDRCICFPGYYSRDGDDDVCSRWTCGEFEVGDELVCSGMGECVAFYDCECSDDYEGELCDKFSCGFESTSPLSCNGNGNCLAPRTCDCNDGYDGELCENNLLLGYVMAPILSVTGVGAMFMICCICCCCVCTTFISICIVGTLVSFLLCLGRIMKGQKNRMKKFDKLKNVDLLLREQELDEDTSVAHLRIKQELYQIDFEEIVVDKILGEGGSMSVVFKAFWKNRIVAFKCFKTRHVMENQDCYNEFEREVSIQGSINHPYIINFYGATLKPPRVGIVMEYCEHGDLDVFLRDFKEKYGIRYPLKEKMRMFYEISSALDFLHNRKIIHRDVKLENVLVDSQLTCKLMDFGLSKVVDRMSKQKTKNVGTSIFIAPELVTGEGEYDEKVDVFSFAIMMWIAVTENRNPYNNEANNNMVEIRVANNPNYRPSIECCEEFLGEEHNEWICKIITTCWNHDSSVRMSMSEISNAFEEKLGKSGIRSSLVSSFSVESSIRNSLMRQSKRNLGGLTDFISKDMKIDDDENQVLKKQVELLVAKMKEYNPSFSLDELGV